MEDAARVGDDATADLPEIADDAIAQGDEGTTKPDNASLDALKNNFFGATGFIASIVSPPVTRSQSRRFSRRSNRGSRGSNRGSSQGSRGSHGSHRRTYVRGCVGEFSSTWPCPGSTGRVPWVRASHATTFSQDIDVHTSIHARSGAVKTTVTKDGSGASEGADEEAIKEQAPGQLARTGMTASETTGVGKEDVGIANDAKPGHAKTTETTESDDAFGVSDEEVEDTIKQQELLQPAAESLEEKHAEVQAAEDPRSENRNAEAQAGEDPGSEPTNAAAQGQRKKGSCVAFACNAFNSVVEPSKEETSEGNQSLGKWRTFDLSKNIIHKIRGDLSAPKPVPKQPMLCGRCKPLEVTKTANFFPDKRLHRDLTSSFDRVANIAKGCVKVTRQDHFEMDLDDVKMPSKGVESLFSRKPHPKFKTMSVCDAFQLEVSLMQHKVKEPLLKEIIADELASKSNQKLQDLLADLDMSSLRMIVQMKPSDRSFEESLRVFQFLKTLLFFKDLDADTIALFAMFLEVCRYDIGEELYKKGQPLTGIYIVLRGKVTIKDVEVMRTEEEQEGIHGRKYLRKRSVLNDDFILAELSAKECAENEEMLPSNRVFGVSDLLQEILWPAEAVHQGTAVVEEIVEAFVLPANKMLLVLEDKEFQERIKALQQLFPFTRGKSQADLEQPSKVERDGIKPPVHRLFQVCELPKHHRLFSYGETPPPEVSRIYLVLSGSVQLNGLLKIQDTVTTGAVLGDEALRCDPYYHTASVASDKVRVMWIRVDEFVTQFMAGKFKATTQKLASQAIHPPSAWAGKLWKKGLQAVMDREKFGEHDDDEDLDPEEHIKNHDILRVLKHIRDKNLQDTKDLWVTYMLDSRETATQNERVRNYKECRWKSSVAPKTVPKRIAPAEMLTSPRERLRALSKSDDECNATTRRKRWKTIEVLTETLSAIASSSESQANKPRATNEEEVVLRSSAGNKRILVTSSKFTLGAFCNTLDDMPPQTDPLELGEAADSSPALNLLPKKSVTFEPQESTTWSEDSANQRKAAIEKSVDEPRQSPFPAFPSGRKFSQARRRPPGSLFVPSVKDTTESPTSQKKPGKLVMVAQSILASPRPAVASPILERCDGILF